MGVEKLVRRGATVNNGLLSILLPLSVWNLISRGKFWKWCKAHSNDPILRELLYVHKNSHHIS